jgi:hypothetical protein
MRNMNSSFAFLILGLVSLVTAEAQQAAPVGNLLDRVLMVESQYGRGTVF